MASTDPRDRNAARRDEITTAVHGGDPVRFEGPQQRPHVPIEDSRGVDNAA
jgi:hypothetical protein